uniref:Uncharacterized protein n=2 Tax=Cacopsylla melanoneura TaxID=428564 RepID=A0A8D8Z1P1_9HEMI
MINATSLPSLVLKNTCITSYSCYPGNYPTHLSRTSIASWNNVKPPTPPGTLVTILLTSLVHPLPPGTMCNCRFTESESYFRETPKPASASSHVPSYRKRCSTDSAAFLSAHRRSLIALPRVKRRSESVTKQTSDPGFVKRYPYHLTPVCFEKEDGKSTQGCGFKIHR